MDFIDNVEIKDKIDRYLIDFTASYMDSIDIFSDSIIDILVSLLAALHTIRYIANMSKRRELGIGN